MSVAIAPTAQVHSNVALGADVEIGPFCVVEEGAEIGDRTKLFSHVAVTGKTTIGEDCLVYPHAYLGGPPQDFKYQGEDTRLFIGARNIIREHVTMHIGTGVGRGETRVGNDSYYMVGSHVGHDCIVGDQVTFANLATLGGHVHVGDQVIMGGLSAVHQHCRIGRHAFIGGGAPVTGDVIPYGMVDNQGRLAGLNLVGLKRRGFPREAINDMRTAYRLFFADEGSFQERVEDAARLFNHRPEAVEMADFVRAPAQRPLCLPEGR